MPPTLYSTHVYHLSGTNSFKNSPKNSILSKKGHRKVISNGGIDLSKIKAAILNGGMAKHSEIAKPKVCFQMSNKFLRQLLKKTAKQENATQFEKQSHLKFSITRKNSVKSFVPHSPADNENYKTNSPPKNSVLTFFSKEREMLGSKYKTECTKMDKQININAELIDPIYEERLKLISYISEYTKQHEEVPLTNLSYYKIIKIIGKGAFGVVSLGIHLLTGKQVAIKTIAKECMKDKLSKRKIFQEIFILKKIKHSNVIRLLEVFETKTDIMIVMEYAESNLITRGRLTTIAQNRRTFKQRESGTIV